jgi:hypothetical protein
MAIEELASTTQPLRFADPAIDDALVRILDPQLGDEGGLNFRWARARLQPGELVLRSAIQRLGHRINWISI